MANEEQVNILKLGIALVWDGWRANNPDATIDLIAATLPGANLSGFDLRGVDLSHANIKGANLSSANLSGANFSYADLRHADLNQADLGHASFIKAKLDRATLKGADLRRANLQEVDLLEANLQEADLLEADLTKADLLDANLTDADLRKANLTGARLVKANLRGVQLQETQFMGALVGFTSFTNIDFSGAIGLEDLMHSGPSSIAIDTFVRSKGKIPDSFLRECGLSDWDIQAVKLYNPDLSNEEITNIQYGIYDHRAKQALQISPLFISYSRADREFVDKIGDALTKRGIRYWRDIHEMKAGRIEKQIDHAIRQHPTVLLVLSEQSVKSDWVEHEIRIARALEKETGRDVFCPVALDASWQKNSWPQRLMKQIMEYNVLDFSEWQDNRKFDGMFHRLLDGLELFYKG